MLLVQEGNDNVPASAAVLFLGKLKFFYLHFLIFKYTKLQVLPQLIIAYQAYLLKYIILTLTLGPTKVCKITITNYLAQVTLANDDTAFRCSSWC